MKPLTNFQAQCLTWIEPLIADKPWLPPSYIMAHVRIESGWDPSIKASDFASTGSVGLMQVSTPAIDQVGAIGQDQTDPQVSLATGIAYIAWLRSFLMFRWGFKDSILYRPVCMAYNEGPGSVLNGRRDNVYYLKWAAAQQGYAFVDGLMPP